MENVKEFPCSLDCDNFFSAGRLCDCRDVCPKLAVYKDYLLRAKTSFEECPQEDAGQ